MDRLRAYSADNPVFSRRLTVVLVLLVITGVLAGKAITENWFEPRTPLDLSNAPLVLFFNQYKGCECEMVVYQAAENQILKWKEDNLQTIEVISIDLNRRPDLAQQYGIIRAPAILLVGHDGKVVYSQKEIVTDDAPINLTELDFAIVELNDG